MMRRPLLVAIRTLLVLALLAAGIRDTVAQSTASVRGTVTDAQGGVVPGASIVVRSQATGVERERRLEAIP